MIDRVRLRMWVSLTILAVLLAACGGGGDGSATGRLNLSMTDAPVDGAAAVVVTVASLTLEGVQGSADQGPFDIGEQFDLLSYQGTESKVLLVDLPVEPGTYKVRLDLDLNLDDKPATGSYVVFDPGTEECPDSNGQLPDGVYPGDGESCRYPLRVPSGEQAGFRPKGELVVTADATSSFTVEFDLRRNMVEPSNADPHYVLKPTGLRLVDDATVGIVRGDIHPDFFDASACMSANAKVYFYDLTNGDGSTFPDDIHDANTTYVTSVGVEEVPANSEDGSVTYRYVIGFVEPGSDYAVALTCEDDSPEDDDSFTFVAEAKGIEVSAGRTTTQDL